MTREIRKTIERKYGQHKLIDYCYCEGSRSVRDFLESIEYYRSIGDSAEAEFWSSELKTLVPAFEVG